MTLFSKDSKITVVTKPFGNSLTTIKGRIPTRVIIRCNKICVLLAVMGCIFDLEEHFLAWAPLMITNLFIK